MRHLRDRSNPEHASTRSGFKCIECGKILSSWQMYDSNYCKDCFEVISVARERSYKRCMGCHEFYPPSELYDNKYCPKCMSMVKKCEFCGKDFISDKKTESFCPLCSDSLSRACIKCGNDFVPDKSYYNICPSCYNVSEKKDQRKKEIKSKNDNKTEKTISLLKKALNDKDPNSRLFAVEAFSNMGLLGVEHVLRALNDNNEDVRDKVLDVFSNGPLKADYLIDALKDGEYDIRRNAVKSLGMIRHPSAVNHLIESLNDEEPVIRRNAAKALGEIGDKRALNFLTESLYDVDMGVCNFSARSIGRIGCEESIDLLYELNENDDSHLRICAIKGFYEAELIDPIINAVDDENSDVRKEATKLLGMMEDSTAVRPLINALDDEDSYVRKNAAISLGRIGDQRAVEPLTEALTDGNSFVEEKAKEALFLILDEENVEEILKNLEKRVISGTDLFKFIKALDDDDPEVRINAAKSLGRTNNVDALSPLFNALNDKNIHVRWEAEESIAKLGKMFVNDIIRAFENCNDETKYIMAVLLGEIDSDEVVDPLIEALNDSDKYVRANAAEALGKIGNQRAVEPLIECLREDDLRVKRNIIKSIGSIGGLNELEKLKPLLKDEEGIIRAAARNSIEKIKANNNPKNETMAEEEMTSNHENSEIKGISVVFTNDNENSESNPLKLLRKLR